MKTFAPVILFVFKREEHTRKCLEALNENENVQNHDLYIFADGARNEAEEEDVGKVRRLIREFEGQSRFHSVNILESDRNKGLARSIIGGVTEVINQYGKAIVVEDDLITSKDFLTYMDGALDYYEADEKIGSISGSTYPVKGLRNCQFDVYAIKKGECWGWGTWAEVWNQVDWSVSDFKQYMEDAKMRREFDSLEYGLDKMLCNQMEGKIDSWAVRWCYHLFRRGLLTVYPKESKALNIGLDGSGTHCSQDFNLDRGFGTGTNVHFVPVEYSRSLAKEVARYERDQVGIGTKILGKLKQVFGGK